jgi:hypothetical protein
MAVTLTRSQGQVTKSTSPRPPSAFFEASLLARGPFKIPISGVAVLTELGLGLIWCNLLATMGARQRVA